MWLSVCERVRTMGELQLRLTWRALVVFVVRNFQLEEVECTRGLDHWLVGGSCQELGRIRRWVSSRRKQWKPGG